MGTSKMNHKLCMCAASEMPGVWIKLHCIVCLSVWDALLSVHLGWLFPPYADFFDTLFPSGNLSLCNILLPLSASLSRVHMSIYLKSLRPSYLGSSASFLTLGKAGSWVSFYLEAIRTAKICLDSLHLPAHPPLPNPSHNRENGTH